MCCHQNFFFSQLISNSFWDQVQDTKREEKKNISSSFSPTPGFPKLHLEKSQESEITVPPRLSGLQVVPHFSAHGADLFCQSSRGEEELRWVRTRGWDRWRRLKSFINERGAAIDHSDQKHPGRQDVSCGNAPNSHSWTVSIFFFFSFCRWNVLNVFFLCCLTVVQWQDSHLPGRRFQVWFPRGLQSHVGEQTV